MDSTLEELQITEEKVKSIAEKVQLAPEQILVLRKRFLAINKKSISQENPFGLAVLKTWFLRPGHDPFLNFCETAAIFHQENNVTEKMNYIFSILSGQDGKKNISTEELKHNCAKLKEVPSELKEIDFEQFGETTEEIFRNLIQRSSATMDRLSAPLL